MARRTQFVIISSIFISFVFAVTPESCIKKSPCSCEFDDGRKIDLKPLEDKDFLTAHNTNNGHNLTYYFHACSDKKLILPGVLTIHNECEQTSLCLLNQTGNATAINLGHAQEVKFNFATNSKNYLVFNQNTRNITTLIRMVCTPDYTDPKFYFEQIDSTTAHNLILFSDAICPLLSEKPGLSTGSVLVILLCIFSAVYLLGGATILHFLRGARGKEMIPNFEFWTDLPCLVKDGAVFLQNGCKPVVISTSESYDRI